MSTKESKRSARDKLAEERRRQAAADKRKRTITNTVIAVVVVAAIVAIFVVVQNQRQQADVKDNAALARARHRAGRRHDVWRRTGHCRPLGGLPVSTLQGVRGSQRRHAEPSKVDAGEITMVVHPLSFMDQNLQQRLVRRWLRMPSAVPRLLERRQLWPIHSKLFAEQPQEAHARPLPGATMTSSAGAQDVGVDDADWESCVNDGTYCDWVTR